MKPAFTDKSHSCSPAVPGRRHCFLTLSRPHAVSQKQNRPNRVRCQHARVAPVCAARSELAYATEGAAGDDVAETEREANKVDEEPASSSTDEENSTETRQAPKHIDESDPERAPYHRQLLAAAKDGRAQDAADLIESMTEAGLPPGSRAYHGLICAHCKARDTDSALSTVRQAVLQGLQPIAETYMVLMHSFIAEGDRRAAFKVFQSMNAAGMDVQRGWLLLCKDCLRYEFGEDAYAWYKRGGHEGWRPDADMYAQLLSWMCTQEGLVDEAETIIRKEMPEAGIQPTTRHANPLVFAEAMFVSVHTAIGGPLKEMQQGRLGVGCRPNADTYNCIIMGCLKHVHEDGNAVYETLQEIKGDMIVAGLKFNKTTHALFVEVHLLTGQVEFAMLAFEDMVKLARPGAVTECLTDEAITELVFALARTNQPKHLIRVLGVLVEDGRPLPIQALVPINMDGLSFVTSWIPAALGNARTLQEVEGLAKQSEAAEEEDFREIDGTLVGPGNFAVTDDGAVISASKLTVPQLKAELTARGLPIEGKRADLYRRVQAARSTAPREVADEVRMQEKRAAQKTVREETALKTKIAKDKEGREVVWTMERWKDGKLVSVKEVVEIEEEAAADARDGEWDEDEQGAAWETAAGARPELGAEEGELDAEEEQRKFKAGETQQPFWPQDQLVSDMAIHLALMVEELGLSASPNDWTQIAKAAADEGNEDVAHEVVARIPALADYRAAHGDARLLETLERAEFKITDENLSEVVEALM